MDEARARRSAVPISIIGATPGIYAEFLSAGPTAPLPLERIAAHGATLLAVKADQKHQTATVFMPDRAVARFLRKVGEYQTKERDTKKGRPRHERLAAPIETIGLATVRSLWTDDPARIPGLDAETWFEVWLTRAPIPGAEVARLETFAAQAGLRVRAESRLIFPERVVVLALGSLQKFEMALDVIGDIAELRLAKPTPYTLLELSPREQALWTEELRNRVTPAGRDGPAVCVLDTGVNAHHPLLRESLDDSDVHVYDALWNREDRVGHGTRMAGLALYGDLHPLLIAPNAVRLEHRLESVKILPDSGNHPPELYGHVTRESVSRVEVQKPERKRAFCLAVTSLDARERGRPSSWSAAVDALASGADEEDQTRRLLLLSAGNRVSLPSADYLAEMQTEEIHDPAQAWNAVTVGAYTQKIDIGEPDLKDWRPLAPSNTLSPWTTTGLVWKEAWPLKPDVLLEGGNIARNRSPVSPSSF